MGGPKSTQTRFIGIRPSKVISGPPASNFEKARLFKFIFHMSSRVLINLINGQNNGIHSKEFMKLFSGVSRLFG